jgi:hypothetical protein
MHSRQHRADPGIAIPFGVISSEKFAARPRAERFKIDIGMRGGGAAKGVSFDLLDDFKIFGHEFYFRCRWPEIRRPASR